MKLAFIFPAVAAVSHTPQPTAANWIALIIVVVIARGEDEQISDLISRLFVNNGLEKWGLAGTVLVLITVEEGWS